MTRIFLSLALLSLLLLGANLLVGLATGDYQQIVQDEVQALADFRLSQHATATAAEKSKAAEIKERLFELQKANAPYHRWKMLHMFLGVFAALVTLLVNSVAITYFIGTSRWCKEVVDAYRLSPQLEIEGQRIKRQSFAWSLVGIFTIIGIIALGASADPTAWNFKNAAWYVTPHYLSGLLGTAVIAFAYWRQWERMSANYGLVDRVMDEVRRVKESRAAMPIEVSV